MITEIQVSLWIQNYVIVRLYKFPGEKDSDMFIIAMSGGDETDQNKKIVMQRH